MTTLAVVGATGYIGRSVCSRAEDRGWTVIRCPRSGVSTAWSEMAWETIDSVVNCAGIGMNSSSNPRGRDLIAANLLVPVSAASLAIRSDASLVHIGSAAQRSERLGRESPYVQSKTLASLALRLLADTDGLRGVELMPHIIYGGEGSSGVVDAMVRSIVSGEPFALRTPGVRRDFVHEEDVSRAVIAAVETDDPSWFSVEIGTGEGHALSEAAEMIGKLAGMAIPWRPEAGPGRTWSEDLVADPDPAHDALGFVTEIPLQEGLVRMVREMVRGSHS